MSETTERARLRPVLISIVSNYPAERAVDMILRVIEAQPPPAEQAPQPSAALIETPGRRARACRAPPPLPGPESGVRPLRPDEYYTVVEAEAYLGIKSQMIRNIMNDDPELIPSKTGGNGATLLLGRGIIDLRTRREKAASDGQETQGKLHESAEHVDSVRADGHAH